MSAREGDRTSRPRSIGPAALDEMDHLGRGDLRSGDDENPVRPGCGRTSGFRDLPGAGSNSTGSDSFSARAADVVTAVSANSP
jgi:hypothetical protein